jgi:hypothetical protein
MRNRRLSRSGPAVLLAVAALLAGCEQPVRPVNAPTPRQLLVAEALNVPVHAVQAFDREGLRGTPAAGPRPDPSSAAAQRLRRELELLAQAHSAGEGATP